jgi:hypothetical protein
VQRFLCALILPPLLIACSDGSPGDLALVPKPEGNILGNGARLYELNDLTSAKHPKQDAEVIATGVSVVIVDSFDETHNGSSAGNVFAEDLPVDGKVPPFGGITLFDVSFSPPTLRVGPGDVVDIRGSYQEFAGPSSSPFNAGQSLPEIVGSTVSLRFEYKPLDPVLVDIADLGSYDTGRKWIGMLARIENVTAQANGSASASGRYSIKLDVPNAQSIPTISNGLFDLENSGVPLTAGTSYKSITGVIEYFYNFTICPRSAADIELP